MEWHCTKEHESHFYNVNQENNNYNINNRRLKSTERFLKDQKEKLIIHKTTWYSIFLSFFTSERTEKVIGPSEMVRGHQHIYLKSIRGEIEDKNNSRTKKCQNLN